MSTNHKCGMRFRDKFHNVITVPLSDISMYLKEKMLPLLLETKGKANKEYNKLTKLDRNVNSWTPLSEGIKDKSVLGKFL